MKTLLLPEMAVVSVAPCGIYFESIAVVAVQAVVEAEPHEPLAILVDAFDEVLWQALLNNDVLELDLFLLSVKVGRNKIGE